MCFCKINSQLETWNYKTTQTPKRCANKNGGNHSPLPTTSVPGTRHTLQIVGWNGGATNANGNGDLKLGRYIRWISPSGSYDGSSRCQSFLLFFAHEAFFLQTNRDWVARIFKLFSCKFLLIFFIPNSTDLDVAAIFTQVESSNKYLGGGNSNIFYFHPENWANDPIWRA